MLILAKTICQSRIYIRVQDSTFLHTLLPFLGLNWSLKSSSIAGIKNAKVFPLPVFAAPSKSLEENITKFFELTVSSTNAVQGHFLPILKKKATSFKSPPIFRNLERTGKKLLAFCTNSPSIQQRCNTFMLYFSHMCKSHL